MRFAGLFVAVAACGPQWKQAPPREPEPDSSTEYTSTERPPPQLRSAAVQAAGTSPAPTRLTCTNLPHATAAGVTVVVANASTFVHDLCVTADRALGLLSSPQGLAGLELNIMLKSVRQHGIRTTCQVAIGARTPTANLGVFNQSIRAQAASPKPVDLEASKRDCVDANLDDIVRQRVAPLLQPTVP